MKENINRNSIITKITPIIEKLGYQLGLVILEINFVKESGRWYLRIFIHKENQSITHKDCEDLTRSLENYLDELIPVHYYLEVSSPGTERKLKSSKEYTIFNGKKVEIKLKQALDDNLKVFDAKIVGYSPEDGLKLLILKDKRELVIDEKNISHVKLKADYII